MPKTYLDHCKLQYNSKKVIYESLLYFRIHQMNEISPQFFFVTQIADVLQKKNPSVILMLVSNIGAG